MGIRVGLVVLVLAVAGCGSVAVQPDAAPPCPGGLTACGDGCVNTHSDNLNCGSCDHPCDSGYACSADECQLTCQVGLVGCGTECIDPDTDPDHCGASLDCLGNHAGTACGPGGVCNGSGSCATNCPLGLVGCGGSCIDANTNETYCGATGTCQGTSAGTRCNMGETCMNGTCTSPAQLKRVFISSQVHAGGFNGLTGADAFCQGLATQAGLPGTYMAWLADAFASPTTRFTHAAVPYVLVDGTVIAQDWADLTDGVLLAPIGLTETGSPAPSGTASPQCGNVPTTWSNVWLDGTRYDPNPMYDYSCQGWTVSDPMNMANWGNGADSSLWWTTWCNGGMCSYTAALYCFQQ